MHADWASPPGRIAVKIRELVEMSLAATSPELVPMECAPGATLYGVYAYDIALDSQGAPKLLEINSHPAIADGTMAAVPSSVYTRLVTDVLSLVVLPALDGCERKTGGFEQLQVGWNHGVTQLTQKPE